MAEMITIKEAAARWNLTERRVNELCRVGRIEGACKNGSKWEIPANAEKPRDLRRKSPALVRNGSSKKLPLPIGISDYRKASFLWVPHRNPMCC